MWISKQEIASLSQAIQGAMEGAHSEIRDNREGHLSILKNDIDALLRLKEGEIASLKKERDMLSEYLADISHQLKTPITSMMIATELVGNAPADKQQAFIASMRSSLYKMDWLVSTLLKMAKLDAGAITFSPQECLTSDLVQRAISPLAIMLDVKDQSVEVVEDAKIVCDSHWTTEAMTNILKNASEHSPKGSVLWVHSGENPIYRWLAITDSGEGVTREQQANLFKRFENSTSENGYGIGLPLALSIMRSQNGDIEVTSAGKGTTFKMKFYK